MRIKFAAALLVGLCASNARAEDPAKCFNTRTSRAMLRKYNYKYVGPPGVSSRTSGQEGSSKVSSARSTQNVTMISDPGVSTGESTSSTEFSSSYGDCDYFGLNQRQIQREAFIAENLPELKRDIARGRGERLDILAYYSACNASATGQLAGALRSNYADLQGLGSGLGEFSSKIDTIIQRDPLLSRACQLKA